MGRVTKEAWKQSSLRTKEVEVPELGGSVLIRELPSDVAADLQGLVDVVRVGAEQRVKVAVPEMEAREFAYGVIDEASGEPMFTIDEAKGLAHQHGAAFRKVVEAIDELSGLDKKSVEETEARFPGGGAEANGSDVGVSGGPGPAVHPRAGAGAAQDGPGAADG